MNEVQSFKIECNVCNSGQFLSYEVATQHFKSKKHKAKFFKSDKGKGKTAFSWIRIKDAQGPSFEQILEHFTQYGNIVNAIFKTNYTSEALKFVEIQYDSSDAKKKVLADANHKIISGFTLDNFKVFSSPVKSKPTTSTNTEEQTEKNKANGYDDGKQKKRKKSHEKNSDLKPLDLSFLKNCSTDFLSQCRKIEQAKLLSNAEKKIRYDICNDIEVALSAPGISVKAIPFGSSVNGFGYKGCDLDVFVDIDLPDKDPSSKVRWSKKAIFQNNNIFEFVIAIPNARVPLLKIIHKKSNVTCDLSFSNALPVKNTSLIKFLSETDERVRLLIVFLRFWGKKYGLCNGQDGFFINSYALTMMIAFYLQQLDNPILHPVKVLQDCNGSVSEDELVNGWNSNFTADVALLPKLESNVMELLDLTRHFFTFYVHFDFKEMAISPYRGHPVKKENLLKEFPTIYDFKKPMVVQDPFERDHCITKGVSDFHIKCLKQLFQMGIELLESNSRPSAHDLLTLPFDLKSLLKKKNRRLKRVNEYFFKVKNFSISKIIELQQIWNGKDIMFIILRTIFSDIFLINDLDDLKARKNLFAKKKFMDQTAKQKSLCNQDSEDFRKHHQLGECATFTLKGKIPYEFLANRGKFKSNGSSSVLERESDITNKIVSLTNVTKKEKAEGEISFSASCSGLSTVRLKVSELFSSEEISSACGKRGLLGPFLLRTVKEICNSASEVEKILFQFQNCDS